MTKYCKQCDTTKPKSEFNKSAAKKDGLGYYCRQCSIQMQKEWREKNPDKVKEWRESNPDKLKEYEERRIEKQYGITAEQYNNLLDQQNNRCAICGGVNKNGYALSIDHDHSCCPGKKSCGKCIRRLLCDRCNWGLGHFRDNPEILRVAAKYIEDHRTNGPGVDFGISLPYYENCQQPRTT